MEYDYKGSNLTLEQLKAVISDELSIIRSVTLDKFQKQSSGISRIYTENILAAQRYLKGDISPLSNGMAPTNYLTGFGQAIGLHSSQFAAYVLSENQRLGTEAYQVELKYLQGKGILATQTDGNLIITWFESYKQYCSTITGI